MTKLRSVFLTAATIVAAALLTGKSAQAQDGRNVISSGVPQNCGVMLGGIGSGYLELWPDGCIHDWGIFNRGRWGYRGDYIEKDKRDRRALGEMNAEALQFFVRAAAPGSEPVVRRLSTDGELMNVYSYNTWLQNVDRISFDYTFPGARLEYHDATLPVSVKASFFSPVVPHDLKTTGTPGFYAVFTVKNHSTNSQEVSLAAYLRNPLARGGGDGAETRKLRNTIVSADGTTFLNMRTEADLPYKTTLGSMCLSMNGGTPSWVASDFGEFLVGRTLNIKPWNQRYETVFRDFRFKGVLPNAAPALCPTSLGSLRVGGSQRVDMTVMPGENKSTAPNADQIKKLTDEEVGQIIEQARATASLRSIVDQAAAVDADMLVPSKKGRELVDCLYQAVSQYAGENGRAVNWGDGMLCSSLVLKPGEEREVSVILAWHFPNHPSPRDARNMGHMYSNWFKDAEEVNRFLANKSAGHGNLVGGFRELLGKSTLPPELMSAVSIQLNTMICSTWWTADDKVGVWEGLGTIGQNTVDVSYQGSHPFPTLFPEFEQNWTRLATRYQNPTTGRLYHSLPNDLDSGGRNNGYGYVDVNCHFVLEMCRDYLWFGNPDYLKFFYPHVVKGLGVFEGMDSDGDGLPDEHTKSNTYDTWELRGTPAYMSSIWIAALRGGIRMAEDAGDKEYAAKWKAILEKALKSLEAKLWNGEYYSLWVDGSERDEACMTDQLSGEMYAKLIGLGNSIPSERVRKVLAVIYKYNYTPEQGLFNGTYPPGRQPRMPTFRNVQGEGNWTGIEYASAAMMIDQGMVKEGMSVIRAVEQRYLRGGRLFNHEECGPHYYRPMSIWAAFLATTGFKVDAPRGILTIAPPLKQEKMVAPWFSATGYGQFTRTGSAFDLACREGTTTFRELRVNVPGVKNASLDGRPVAASVENRDGLSVFRFAQPVSLSAGKTFSLN